MLYALCPMRSNLALKTRFSMLNKGIKNPNSLFLRANEQPQPRYLLTATDPLEQFKGYFGFNNWN
jgi:hypothetical protein